MNTISNISEPFNSQSNLSSFRQAFQIAGPGLVRPVESIIDPSKSVGLTQSLGNTATFDMTGPT